MAVQLPGYPSQDTESEDMPIEIHYSRSQWYFSRQELEYYSPSRKDGVDFMTESGLRKLYCSFIQELGMELRVAATQTRPLMTVFVCKGLGLFLKLENTKKLIFMVTIAASMMLCHRFYMRQSHAKNDWQTVATVCVFLACKTEDTPSRLCDVTVVSYKLMYKWDPSAPERIKQKDVYDKQKQLILMGERIVLTTIAYDMNIELPYKPLVAALKRLEISNKDLWTVAWNFVNDWLRTSLCLQYKPHYIAAGAMFLASEDLKIKLPTDMGKVWYMQFDVAPRQLEEVIQDMRRYLDKKRKRATPLVPAKPVESKPLARKSTPNNFPQSITQCSSNINQQTVETSNSTQSCVLNGSNHVGPGSTVGDQKLDRSAPSNNSDCGSASSTVEDGDGEPKPGDSHTVIEVRNSKIDVKKIREAMKRRREGKTVDKEMVKATNDELGSEAWIEMELENGIKLD